MKTELRRVAFHDLLKYRFLSAPRFSPDGKRIVFAVHQASREDDRYLSDLWLYDLETEACTALTHSGAEGPFCWDRAGDRLLLISGRAPQPAGPKPDEKAPKMSQLYSLPIGGRGEAEFVAALSRTVTALWDTPSGVLLQTIDLREPERFEDAAYRVLEQIPFCANGSGFTAQRRSRLALLTGEGVFEDLTPETMDVRQVRLSEDGSRVFVIAADYEDVMPVTTGLWELELETRALEARLPQGHFAWACAAPFAGGILLTGTDMKHRGLNENMSFFLTKGGCAPQCLTPTLDTSLHNSVVCDCRYGIGDIGETFIVDGDRAWYVTTEGCHSCLFTVNAQGNVERLSHDLRSVDDFDVHEDRAAVVGLEGLNLQELYLVENGSERRLTNFNTATLDGIDLSVPEYVHLENGTPEGLDCWYMRPVGFEIGRKYPAILHVHGGPRGAFGDVFVHEMQCWAAEGFAVLFCNPRGGDGKGGAFADIRGKYGVVDYEDLMAFVDWAVQTLPFVDGDRLGVTGGSYGGFMTNWIIGHTNRFRAAVTQRSICNWISMVGMSDIGYYFVPDQQSADLGEDVSALWDRSPLKYAAQMTTPTLIIHSDEDHRCELGQGLQLFTALKRNGVEAKMCVFKGENHELSRSGRPKQRLARLQEIARWMKERL
ncbi:MAG: S9 family peptidase [Fretibacterium sp.]|nr:S9 family peptidase [Fretibacterium sp.]